MDPASILTIVVTSLSVIVKTSICLKELSQKYRSVDQEISLIIIRLNNMEAIVSQIGSWLRSESKLEEELAKDVRMAVSACDFVVGEIYRHIERVRDGWFGGRIRHMWTEEQQLQYQRSLDSQISAMSVLLNVAVLKSQSQRCELSAVPSNSKLASQGESAESHVAYPLLPVNFRTELFRSRVYKGILGAGGVGSETRSTDGRSGSRSERASNPQKRDSEEPSIDRAPTVNTASGGSSNPSADSISSVRRSLSQKFGWHQDNRAKLSEELRIAVHNDKSSAADELCSNGADANFRHYKPEDTPKGSLRSIIHRVVHRPYGRGEPTLLHHAAERGNLDIIRTLVSHGAVLDARDREGRTPLHLANDNAAGLLLSLGADGSAKDRKESTPLHYMAARCHANAVAELLKRESNVNAFDISQQTPLHLACIGGDRKTVSSLIEAGAFLDASDRDGLRPLHSAAKHGHDRIVRGLLRAGADPEVESRRGWRPIHYAARGQNTRVVDSLAAVPVNVDASVPGGRTPLHVATSSGQKDAVEILLKAGANAELADDDGNTPLFLAVAHSSVQGAAALVQVLLEHEARVNTVCQAGHTPLSTACSRQSSALIIVQMLLSSGAQVRYEDYVSLWRNSKIPAREKKAIHAELDAVAPEELKKDEVEWLITTL